MYLPPFVVLVHMVLQHCPLAAPPQALPVKENNSGTADASFKTLTRAQWRLPVVKSFVLKRRRRAGYLVAAWTRAHPWTRLPCYGGQDQVRQGQKDARGGRQGISLVANRSRGRTIIPPL
jgi:hypothetical protein